MKGLARRGERTNRTAGSGRGESFPFRRRVKAKGFGRVGTVDRPREKGVNCRRAKRVPARANKRRWNVPLGVADVIKFRRDRWRQYGRASRWMFETESSERDYTVRIEMRGWFQNIYNIVRRWAILVSLVSKMKKILDHRNVLVTIPEMIEENQYKVQKLKYISFFLPFASNHPRTKFLHNFLEGATRIISYKGGGKFEIPRQRRRRVLPWLSFTNQLQRLQQKLTSSPILTEIVLIRRFKRTKLVLNRENKKEKNNKRKQTPTLYLSFRFYLYLLTDRLLHKPWSLNSFHLSSSVII